MRAAFFHERAAQKRPRAWDKNFRAGNLKKQAGKKIPGLGTKLGKLHFKVERSKNS